MTHPKDPQADIREAIEKVLNAGFINIKSQRFDTGWPFGKSKIHPITSTKAEAINQILALFQAHQQELLSELLSHKSVVTLRDYGGNEREDLEVIPVSVIQSKIGELNGKRKTT